MWTKIEKTRSVSGRESRKSPAVRRGRSGGQAALLIIPKGIDFDAERANIYSDGNGKLAFAPSPTGEFSVFKQGKLSVARNISIPRKWAPKIPFGTTDVELSRDGDMLILDLSTIPAS